MNAQEQTVRAVQAYLSLLKIPVTATTVEQTLTRHPHYPSLLAVSDSLREWRIDHMTVRVKPEQLIDVPTPFFTRLNIGEGQFTVVDSVADGRVRWWSPQRGWQRELISEFLPKWEPVVLAAEGSSNSGEPNYKANRQREQLAQWRNPLLGAGLLLILVLVSVLMASGLTESVSPSWLALLVTKLTGAILSFRLIEQVNSQGGSKLCQIHPSVDCDSVLNSRAATIWGGLSWAEVGLFYFAGGTLALFLGLHDGLVRAVLWGLGVLALPYILFSLYYQARVVRKWCTLCLLVQGVLLIESVLLLSTEPGWIWSAESAARLCLGFLLPLLGWLFMKPIWRKAEQQPLLTQQLNRFRNDPQLFATILYRQQQLVPLPNELQPVWLGNPQADHLITLVINPFCKPCREAVLEVEALVDTYPWLTCQILFTISTDKADPRTAFVRRIYTLPPNERGNTLLTWIRSQSEHLDWEGEGFAIQTNEPETSRQVAMLQWWNANAVLTATPTIYVAGHELPIQYTLTDLPYLVKYGLPVRSIFNQLNNMQYENAE